MDNIINVNVSGKIFYLKKSILSKIPFFNNMFNGCDIHDDIIYLNDHSSIIFEHIISFIVDEKYPFPYEFIYELDFFGIEYKERPFYKHNKELLDKLNINNNNIHIILSLMENGFKNIDMNMKSEQYTCNIKECSYEREFNSIRCKYHSKEKKCLIDNCKNKVTITTNYCENHKYIGVHCNEYNCNRLRIKGKIFCVIHIKYNK